jgi:hypothetical protein
VAQLLKQSTSATIVLGPFVDSTDGFTAETALSLTQAKVRVSKNAAAFAQKSDTTTATHMENGYYSVPLNATDTGTLGRLRVAVTETGALPVWADYMVVPSNVYESLVAGTEWLETTGLRADFSISGATLTVKKTDGSTTQFTQTLTTDAAAVPIIGAA